MKRLIAAAAIALLAATGSAYAKDEPKKPAAATAAKPAAKTGNDSQALLPGAIAALGGLVLACALLGFGLSGSGKQQQQQLVEAWGGSQASALQQAQQQLLADTQAAANDPALLAALQSGDRSLIGTAERGLQHWQGVVDAHGPGGHGVDEFFVAGHVNDAQHLPIGQRQVGVAQLDGDAALLLLFEPVGVGAGQRAHQGGFAVVDVPGGADDHGREIFNKK